MSGGLGGVCACCVVVLLFVVCLQGAVVCACWKCLFWLFGRVLKDSLLGCLCQLSVWVFCDIFAVLCAPRGLSRVCLVVVVIRVLCGVCQSVPPDTRVL